MAIYDTMQFVSCDVATVCLGLAASMGQFLLTAGASGKRFTLPNARIMMHQPLAGLRGQASDIAIQAEQHAYTKRRMAELIAYHSGKSLEQIQKDSERDRWFTAEAAVEYGLCDEVKSRRGRDPQRRGHHPRRLIARRVSRCRRTVVAGGGAAWGTIVATGPRSTPQFASASP